MAPVRRGEWWHSVVVVPGQSSRASARYDTSPVPTLVLFDVDGTLLTGSGPTHLRAFAQALEDVHGAPDPFEVDGELLSCAGTPVNGLVDAQIARLCLAHAGVDPEDPAALERFRTATVDAYHHLVDGGSAGELLPGVVEVLDELDRRGVRAGLLTGNTEEICRVKMQRCGLDGRFATGGFGGVVPDRSQLFGVALDHAARHGWRPDALCYVGDTPLDVQAAARAHVPLVAVCTGHYGPQDLADADAVLGGLDAAGAADTLCAVAATWSP